MKVKITTLIENRQDKEEVLINEHGLALYIECDNKKILFDTGASGNFIKNAEALNKDIKNLDYVVISHGHYDHSGGFKEFLKVSNKLFKLIVGDGFFNKKYKKLEEGYKFNGNSFSEEDIYKENIDINIIKDDTYKLAENIFIFRNFQRATKYEKLNEKFLLKNDNNYVQDEFLDEIALGITHDKGLIVVLGCSHVGIVNILDTITKRTNMRIYAVIGGSHLIEADEERLDKTIEYFKDNNISLLRLSHCTGDKAIDRLTATFEKEFSYNNTGNIIEI